MRTAASKCLATCSKHVNRRFCSAAFKLPSNPDKKVPSDSAMTREQGLTVPKQVVSLLEERDQLLYLGCTEDQQDDWLSQLVQKLRDDKARKPRSKLGLLILTSSKIQSSEVYSKLAELNKDKRLNISRLGSVSYLAPMVDTQEQVTKRRHAELKGISVENLKLIAGSDDLDVLVATIWETSILSPWSKVFKPTYVVLQDFELLYDENHRLLDRALYCMDPETKRIWTSRNSHPKISLQMSHWLPEPDENDPAPVPIIYQSQNERTQVLGRQSKLRKVMDIIKFHPTKRGVVFCKTSTEALELTDHLTKKGVRVFPLTTGAQPYPNSWSLFNYESNPSAVLICEERALRPATTKQADYAVWMYAPEDAQENYYRRRAIIASARIYRIESS